MRRNCISFSVQHIDKLEHIKEGNLMPNFDWFIKEILNQPAVDDIYELWKYTYNQISDIEREHKYESFLHELGTLLLNAKLFRESTSFGFKYGCLVITTYQNNSIPNLYEISVAWPLYSNNPIDLN